MLKNDFRILIATGIYPPDIGGPADYLNNLIKALKPLGVDFEIITYGENKKEEKISRISRKNNLLVRYFLYFWHLFLAVKGKHLIYAQDLFSSGLPAALVKIIRNKKIIIRLGGDFLWEKAINQGWTKTSLEEYYDQTKNWREKVYFWLGKFVLNSADLIIFSSDWQRKIYLKHYQLAEQKTEVINNPFPEVEAGKKEISKPKKIIFAGRLIKLKNISLLIKSFKKFAKRKNLILEIIGEGPEKQNLINLTKKLNLIKVVKFNPKLSFQELVEEIKQSYLLIIPSISEVSPNLVLLAIKLNKPVILTQSGSFFKRFKNKLIFFNLNNQQDLENKIESLLDQGNYQEYVEKLSQISTSYSWPEVAQKHLEIFNKLINENSI